MKSALRSLTFPSASDGRGSEAKNFSLLPENRSCKKLVTPKKLDSAASCEKKNERKSVKRKLDDSFDSSLTTSHKIAKTLCTPPKTLQDTISHTSPSQYDENQHTPPLTPLSCQSPTVNLPNYVLNPEPRTPRGRVVLSEKRPRNWLERARESNSLLTPEKIITSENSQKTKPQVNTPTRLSKTPSRLTKTQIAATAVTPKSQKSKTLAVSYSSPLSYLPICYSLNQEVQCVIFRSRKHRNRLQSSAISLQSNNATHQDW